jgi:uncharacterized protein YqgV (UPF0045/DUF77 family)
LNLIEVILAQGSTFRGLPAFSFSRRHGGPERSPTCHLHELHMAHPSFSRFRRFRLSLVSLSLLACGTTWAQQAPQQAPSSAASPPSSGHMIAEIQVIPRPAGTASDPYKHVDAAIAVIQASGLRYEVHGMGTVVEGPPQKIWPLLQAVHQATLEAGAERTLSIIKVSGSAQAGGPRVEDLVRKFRN